MPGRYRVGVTWVTNTSTPRFIQRPSKDSCIAVTMLDFPDRGAPFRMTI
jgi:hypothetical protein